MTGFVLVPVLVAVTSRIGDSSHSHIHHESDVSIVAVSRRPSTSGGGATVTCTVKCTATAEPAVTVPVMSPSWAPAAATSRNTNSTELPGCRPLGDVHVTVPLPGGQDTVVVEPAAWPPASWNDDPIGWLSSEWPPSVLAGRTDCAVTPEGSVRTAVTGSDGTLPVFVTLMGRSSAAWPGVNVTPPLGPDAVSVGWPGGGAGDDGLVGTVVGVVVDAGGEFGALVGVDGGVDGGVVGGVVVADGLFGGAGTAGFDVGGRTTGWVTLGCWGVATAVGTFCVPLPDSASASTAASAATDAPTPMNCLGTEAATFAAPDAALVVPAVAAAVAAMPAPALVAVAAR